jgi:hypothetical protein
MLYSSFRILNLILSLDSDAGRNLRLQMRSTWLASGYGDVRGTLEYRHVFIIGGTTSPAFIKGDELWLPTDDTYRGGPAKIIDALTYVVQHQLAETFTHVLKSDDDTIVCVPQLMEYLRKIHLGMTGEYAGMMQQKYPDLSYWGEGHKFDDPHYKTVFNRSRYGPRLAFRLASCLSSLHTRHAHYKWLSPALSPVSTFSAVTRLTTWVVVISSHLML